MTRTGEKVVFGPQNTQNSADVVIKLDCVVIYNHTGMLTNHTHAGTLAKLENPIEITLMK